MRLHIDIESYSELDLTKVGVYRYAEHGSTEVLVLCWALTADDHKVIERGTVFPSIDREEFRSALGRFMEFYSDESISLAAHNAAFERVMLSSQAGRKFGIQFRPSKSRWVCTAAKAATWGLPRKLGEVAKALHLTDKDEAGAAIMRKICKPKKPTKKDPTTRYTREKHGSMFEVLDDYCYNDVTVEMEIDCELPDMHPQEQSLYTLDQEINDRGLPVDTNMAERIMSMYRVHEAKLEEESKEIAGISTRQIDEAIEWLRENGLVDIEGLDGDEVDYWLSKKDIELSDNTRRFLEIRAELSRSSVSKYAAMLEATNNDSRLRGMFLFYGAGTGRWSGRIVQLQNLPRGYFSDVQNAILAYQMPDPVTALELLELAYGSPTKAFATTIRSAFIAPEGYEIAQCDYAAVEARVLGWLANDPYYQEAFREGKDLYKVTASFIFGVEYEDVSKDQRQLGKQAVLGLGYQMGLDKFIATCEKQGVFAPRDLYEKAHAGYRGLYERITAYWKNLNTAAVRAVTFGENVVVSHGNAPVEFYVKAGRTNATRWLMIKLPSGRELAYFMPRISTTGGRPQVEYLSVNSVTRRFEYTHSYGGKWCENIVQAVARDLLRDAMPVVEEAGFTIIGHVHDELLTLIKAGSKTKENLEEAMTLIPAWAKGAIIGAEGEIMKRYKK